MVGQFVLVAGLAALIAAGQADAQPTVIDGEQRAHLTDVSYRFACGNVRADFRFRQERRNLTSVNEELGRALSVRLTALVVPGRRIGASFRNDPGGWQRPASVLRTIRISPRGGVVIS